MNAIKHMLVLLCGCALMACAQSNLVPDNPGPSAGAGGGRPDFGDTSTSLPEQRAGASTRPGRGAAPSTANASAVNASTTVTDPAPSPMPDADTDQDISRLDTLYRNRTRNVAGNEDYPIGPGDVLSVSVPPIDELRQRTVRVESDGSISLPMLGTMQAGGLTEKQLQAELEERLKTYMLKPEVELFVREYRSREVAVVGMVNNPGLVTLTAPNETILDVLTRAGGLSGTAADEIILMPAEENKQQAIGRIAEVSANAGDPAAALHGETAGTDLARTHQASFNQGELGALLRQNAHPLIIGLKSTALTGGGAYLNMPVRPGDVIVVPGGGQVMVVGWVQNPGHFQVGSGLTVLGAIGAAGGPMFAANKADVHLIRTRRDGSKLVMKIDLDKVQNGEEADLPVRGNDVIDIPYSAVKVGPYVFYQMLSKMAVGGPAIPTP